MNISEAFAKYEESEFLKFERIEKDKMLHERKDIGAFMLLHKLAPGTGDIVVSAEHDEIWLDVDIEKLESSATEEDILYLIRCGVMYDTETDSLSMFV